MTQTMGKVLLLFLLSSRIRSLFFRFWVRPSVRPFVRSFVPPFVHSFVCLFVRPNVCPLVCPFDCPFVCSSVRPSVRSSVRPVRLRSFFRPSVCSTSFVRSFVRSSVCLSVFVRTDVGTYVRLCIRSYVPASAFARLLAHPCLRFFILSLRLDFLNDFPNLFSSLLLFIRTNAPTAQPFKGTIPVPFILCKIESK